MAQYDLTAKTGANLDRHLVFPLMEFQSDRATFEKKGLDLAKLDLLTDTNMVDFALDIYKSIYGNEVFNFCNYFGLKLN